MKSIIVVLLLSVPAFDVASIKTSTGGGNRIDVTPGMVRAHGATLMTCIVWAYSLQRSQVVSADASAGRQLNAKRYDIDAKSAAPVLLSDLKQMLQRLLTDRFKLAVHRERRDMQRYVLVVDKGGPKFHESSREGDTEERSASKFNRVWVRIPMTRFADVLSEAMEAPVSDETRLTSRYDITLDLTPYLQRTGERPDVPIMMITAVREQLGLRLVSQRAPIDVLVVDHVEQPTPD
jgi:uncharacterized protein (TIGR03435 family)